MIVSEISKRDGRQVSLLIDNNLYSFSDAVILYNSNRLSNVVLVNNSYFRSKNSEIVFKEVNENEQNRIKTKRENRNMGTKPKSSRGVKSNSSSIQTGQSRTNTGAGKCFRNSNTEKEISRTGRVGGAGKGYTRGSNGVKLDGHNTNRGGNPSCLLGNVVTCFNSDPVDFHKNFSLVRDKNPFKSCVDEHTLEELSKMTCLVTKGNTGFIAVEKNGNICSVLKDKENNNNTNFARDILLNALSVGGYKLDCFAINNLLPNLYCDCGFIPVCKIAWNQDYAPDNWNKKWGTPDVVFMYHCGDSPETVLRKHKTYKTYSEYSVPYVEDYDNGLLIRDFEMEKAYRYKQS